MFADGRGCRGRSIPFHISEQSLDSSGCTADPTIDPMDMELDCCEVPARRALASTGMQRGMEASLMAGVWAWDVHWDCSVCDSSSL